MLFAYIYVKRRKLTRAKRIRKTNASKTKQRKNNTNTENKIIFSCNISIHVNEYHFEREYLECGKKKKKIEKTRSKKIIIIERRKIQNYAKTKQKILLNSSNLIQRVH